MRRKILVLMLVALIGSGAAHTGDNHSEQQLQQEEHVRAQDFAFVSGDYPVQTREIAIAGTLLVGVLFIYSIYHYWRNSPEN